MVGKKLEDLRNKAQKVYRCLNKAHPDAVIELTFSNPVELLIATVLSAQCTDVRVNQVTKTLFKKFKTPDDYVKCKPHEIEEIIKPTGFFRQKAKNIRGAMKMIVELHQGNVPSDMKSLTALPGVGRKTANVILGNAFNTPGLPVDTHVRRLSNRLGLTKNQDPVKIEADLNCLLPAKDWTLFSHTLIFHGRRICKARKPNCNICPVTSLCNYYRSGPKTIIRAITRDVP